MPRARVEGESEGLASPCLSYGSTSTKNRSIPHLEPSSQFSFRWRLFHGINYFLGGVYFVFGSICFYLSISWFTLGAVLYSIGSMHFLVADLWEWWSWKEHCVISGLFFPKKEDTTHLLAPIDQESLDCSSSLFGSALSTNLFLSVLGSFLYVIGSIGFLPQIKTPLLGDYGFIVGSVFIVVSQSWKVWRIVAANTQSHFNLGALGIDDITAFGLEFFAGVGGLCFLVATTFYLPELLNIIIEYTSIINTWLVGSFAFLISGSFLMYRHIVLEI